MPIRLEHVVPWGRTMDEYVRMFDLDASALNGKILGCGDGPASFNTEMTALGRRVISCDPIYLFSPTQIRQRVEATRDYMIQAVRENPQEFVWDFVRSPEHLEKLRLGAMEKFLADFEMSKRQGRYVAAGLPRLPFGGEAFDLAVCSHLLFLYSEQLSLDFHVRGIVELCR